MSRLTLLLAVLALGWGTAAASADTVTLKDGTRLDGVVIIETPVKVVLKQPGSNRIIPRTDIESIVKSERQEYVPPPPTPAFQAATAARPSGYQGPGTSGNIENSIVKIYTTIARPDFTKPWARLPPKDETGTGFIIEGNRILTNAHFLVYASQIEVKANGAGDRVPARVIAMSPALDLALLAVEDPTFFTSRPPIQRLGNLPQIKDVVSIHGFASDAANLSIIRTTVVQIDFGTYGGSISGLRVRINNDIGSGASGGPVMDGSQFIGIGCERNVGQASSFVIPAEEIGLFLDAVGSGHYWGKPAVHEELQKLENPTLRQYLNLDPGVHGLVVTRADDPDDSKAVLRPWDVITRVGDQPVDDEGTFTQGYVGRISYAYMVQKAASFQHVPIRVMRGALDLTLSVPAPVKRPSLFPDLDGAYPSYFVYGPIVFSTVTSQLISQIGSSEELASLLSYRGSPMVTRRSDSPAFEGEELVFVPSGFFPHKLASGYSDPALLTVKSINGTAVRNLNHLVQLLCDSADDYIVIEFAERDSEVMVFPRAAMAAATDGILTDNNVRSQGSADMMAVWNAKPAK